MSDDLEDGQCVVRVRAQVMTRDDSTGGWVPMGHGGLSNVSVKRKRKMDPPPLDSGTTQHDYLIYGTQISDQQVILSCVMKRDFEYNKVMPTFHHWSTGETRYGLIFLTAADARAFDKGVRRAVEDLLEGLNEPSPFSSDNGEDDVFMPVELPLDCGDSRSSSGSSQHWSRGGNNSSSTTTTDYSKAHLYHMKFAPKLNPESEKVEYVRSESYPYVQFAPDMQYPEEKPPNHDYSYPNIDATKLNKTCHPKDYLKNAAPPPPLLPTKSVDGKQKRKPIKGCRTVRCQHCQEFFRDSENGAGTCEFAPDVLRSAINAVTCIACAEGMLYHCMSDAEGDYPAHPCSCSGGQRGCGKRWVGLAILSLLLPCLWCYLPLRCCHSLGVRCGICGGRHQAFG